jgi:hypothetical protein
MSVANDHSTETKPGVQVADVAKWLVPSVGALFVVIGFIAQTAQDSLLGLGLSHPGSDTYISAGADFFLVLISTVVNAFESAVSFHAVSFDGFFWWLLVLSVLAALVFRRSSRGASATAALLLLVVLLLGKFLMFDAPLLTIHDVVLRSPPTAQKKLSFVESLRQGTEPLVRTRAKSLKEEILCSRVKDGLPPNAAIACTTFTTAPQYARALNGEFLDQIWATALIVLTGAAVLRTAHRSHTASGAAVLALLYVLMLPYAYGKLQRYALFNVGQVVISSDLARHLVTEPDLALPKPVPDAQPIAPQSMMALPAPPPPAPAPQDATQNLGVLILSRDSAIVDVLVVRSAGCGGGGQSQRIARSTFAAGQVLAVEELYQDDVVAWTARQDHACPRGSALKHH